MTAPEPRNLAASVRQRLLNLARARGEDFNFLLTAYALERLLYRVAQSPHRGEFILKGAMLFRAWAGQPHRPTRDLDLLGRGDASIPRLEEVFENVWRTPVAADGLEVEADSIRGEEIREAQEYGGVRVRMTARLGNARIPLQVDVGFGDAVTPRAIQITYPTLLGGPGPVLPAYPPETVIAEKLQAMVALGAANTRMKDFYDVWILARQLSFDGHVLGEAIAATFRRRATALPGGAPVALTAALGQEPSRRKQWKAFMDRIGQPDAADLPEVVDALAAFLIPPLQARRADTAFVAHWPAGGPWAIRTG